MVCATAPDRPAAIAIALAVVADALRLGIRSRHPAGERPVPAVVRRLEEHRLPELIVAAVARDPDVSRAAAAPGRFPGHFADARLPADLRLARPQLVTERAAFWLVLEQRNGHLKDHGLASGYASIITVAGSEPSPGGLGPSTAIRAKCADGGGGGQGKHRMGLSNGGPDTRSGLAVFLAERPVRLSGKFLSPAGNCSGPVIDAPCVSSSGSGSGTTHASGDLPTVTCPSRRRSTNRADG